MSLCEISLFSGDSSAFCIKLVNTCSEYAAGGAHSELPARQGDVCLSVSPSIRLPAEWILQQAWVEVMVSNLFSGTYFSLATLLIAAL